MPLGTPPLASALSSHPPPEQRNPCPRLFPTSLAPQCGFPFRSGLVLFGASPGLQHPAPTPLGAQPIPGLPGCLRVSVPHFLQPRGGQKPRTPPDSARAQLLHGEAEGHAT